MRPAPDEDAGLARLLFRRGYSVEAIADTLHVPPAIARTLVLMPLTPIITGPLPYTTGLWVDPPYRKAS
jgi:hypothetical protein